MHKVIIKIFSPIDLPELAQDVFDAHLKRLRELDVVISSASNSWLYSPESICICAIDEPTNLILGAVRLQKYNKDKCLPMQDAISPFDSSINIYIDDLSQNGTVAEGCGLWCIKGTSVTREIQLPQKLYALSIAISKYLKIQYCVAIIPKYTMKAAINAGYQKCPSFPSPFAYPTNRFETYVIESNTAECKSPDSDVLNYMLKIHENPNFTEDLEAEGTTYCIKHEYCL